jgi:hypothetical protein
MASDLMVYNLWYSSRYPAVSAPWVAYALEVVFPRDAGSIASKGKQSVLARRGRGDANKAITAVIASSQSSSSWQAESRRGDVASRVVRSMPERIVVLAATLYVER